MAQTVAGWIIAVVDSEFAGAVGFASDAVFVSCTQFAKEIAVGDGYVVKKVFSVRNDAGSVGSLQCSVRVAVFYGSPSIDADNACGLHFLYRTNCINVSLAVRVGDCPFGRGGCICGCNAGTVFCGVFCRVAGYVAAVAAFVYIV